MAVDTFHWIIFGLHLAGALTITIGVWFRCDPDLWISGMRVDTYKLPVNSSGLWWDTGEDLLALAESCGSSAGQSRECFAADLPLYEREPPNLGWHLFALLGHFEWVSAAFAFFYIKGWWNNSSWMVSVAMSGLGTALFLPWRGEKVFANEVLLLIVNFFICVGVFYWYRGVHGYPVTPPSAPTATASVVYVRPQPAVTPQESEFIIFKLPPHLAGRGSMQTDSLRLAELPAMRFAEYCITAAELWVAVLAVFVSDPPAFMTIGGYTLILLTNLYGLLLHYSLISNNMSGALLARVPDQLYMPVPASQQAPLERRELVVPAEWTGTTEQETAGAYEKLAFYMVQHRVWGSFIASDTSTLLNSWLAYAVAMALVFYQQTFLFSPDPPAFVVFAGWSLLAFYTSFGVWITVLYWSPKWVSKMCVWCPRCISLDKDTLNLAVRGLDILSVNAKLSIVGALSYGFVFQAGGKC